MHDLPTTDDVRLADLLAGELSPADEAAAARWLAESPEQATFVAGLRGARRDLGVPDPDPATAAAVQAIARTLAAVATAEPSSARVTAPRSSTRRTPVSQSSSRMRRVVAAAVGAALVAILAFGLTKTDDVSPVRGAAEPGRTYRTANAQQAVVTLPDGSTVTLAPATTLVLEREFGGGARTVRLTGRATFTVTPSTARPFTVLAGDAAVRVLGTQFDVRKYPGETRALVAVLQGKVSLGVQNREAQGRDSRTIILTAGMAGSASDSGDVRKAGRVAIDDAMAWTKGQLVFRDTPLPAVLQDLARAYDVEIVVGDSALAKQLMTLTVMTGSQRLTDVLDLLMPPLDAHYVRTGRVITIRVGHARARSAAPARTLPPLPQEVIHGR